MKARQVFGGIKGGFYTYNGRRGSHLDTTFIRSETERQKITEHRTGLEDGGFEYHLSTGSAVYIPLPQEGKYDLQGNPIY